MDYYQKSNIIIYNIWYNIAQKTTNEMGKQLWQFVV